MKITLVLASLLLSLFQAAAFSIGDHVQATADLNVRSTASTSGALVTTEASGSQGTITSGPTSANGYIWWDISWNNGYSGWSIQDYLQEAPTAPGPVSWVSISAVCNGSYPVVNLSWTAATGATSYYIYRNNSVYKTGITGTSYQDTGVSPGTYYTYFIQAVNSVGATETSTLGATTPDDCGWPSSFTFVSATPGCDGNSPSITLTWTASSGATSYNIYRNNSVYAQGITGTTFENVGANVVAGTTYSYYIQAVNSVAAIESGTLSATAPSNCGGTAPGAFTFVSATPACDANSPEITLNWTASTGATSYYIYRNGNIYEENVIGTTYQDTNVSSGMTYSYQIQAVNSVGAVETGTLSATAPSNCGATQTPIITTQPQNQTANAGATITFTVAASGAGTLSYQWYFNGQIISGATSSTLTLNSVAAANEGSYSVVVSNPYGSVASATASLAVLTDGANGNAPTQPTLPSLPAKSSSANSLIFITHGWQSKILNPLTPPSQQWMADMTNDIAQQLEAKGELGDWQFETYTWLQGLQTAWTELPDIALNNATNIGVGLGMQLAAQGWQRIHLIAHSAGAGMIQEMADVIHANSPSTIIQTTFLDPFVGYDFRGLSWYGANANWSDDYFTPVDTETSPFGDTTGLPLLKAYDVDVSWVGPYQPAHYLSPNGGEVAVSSHGYPIDFYLGSITGGNSSCSSGYGFPLSMEMEGAPWANNPANEPIGVSPVPPCSPPDAILNPYAGSGLLQSIVAGDIIDIEDAGYALSGDVANLIGAAGFELQSLWSVLPLEKSGGVHPLDNTSTNTPAWLAVGVSVSNAVNFVQFDAAFTDTNSAQGLLTVYWNTNQIGMVDERVVETNLQTYRFELPGTVTSGLYTLSFRLDSFNNSSSIAVTNVATGFVGVTQPITLGISITNGAPLLQLTAATNFTYLIQSSTNLVDWTPMALLLNTNGTAQFLDSAVTNANERFYRAVPQ